MKIITTVGTSLLTNYFDKDKNKKSGNSNYLSFYKDKLKGRTFSENDWNNIQNDDYFKNFKKELLDNWIKTDNSCAEIKTLKKLEKENQNYHFLTTNTLDGYFVGEIICDHFELDKEIYLHKIEGLQIDNAQKFKDIGINKLIETIKKIKDDNKDGEVILNISGGYKALIPILTIIGQLENIPLKYIYEDSSSLIEIDNKFLGFDIHSFEMLVPYMDKEFYISIDKNEDEIKIFNELLNRGLIQIIKTESDENEINETIIGNLLKIYFDKYSENSKKPFSFLVEFKIWEYYQKKKLIINSQEFEVFHEKEIRHIEVNNNNPEKPDLFFENKDETIAYAIAEIKSFGEAFNNKVEKSMLRRIEIFKKKNLILKQYILIIYKAPFHDLNRLKDVIKYLKSLVTDVEFIVKYVVIKTFDNEFAYNFQGFLQGNIDIKNFSINSD